MDAKVNMPRETQQQAMSCLYSVATLTADVATLNNQTTRCLFQNNFVAIHFLATAPRSLELDVCGIAIDRHDVNAAVNRNHFKTRFSWESKASIDFIALLINARPNG